MNKRFRRIVSLILIVALSFTLFNFGVSGAQSDELSLDKMELALLLGGSLETLTVSGVPNGAEVIWASDDLRVARVSRTLDDPKVAKVISVGEGTAHITARIGGTILTCTVNVHSDDLLVANDVFILDTDARLCQQLQPCLAGRRIYDG